MAEPDLATLQHWMQSRIVTDALPREAEHDVAALSTTALVRGTPALPAEARMRIYSRSYVLRLIECLRAEFPVLLALVGEQVFDLFATAYLSLHRSQSPTLYDLGAGFADFLEATRPAEGAGRGTLQAIPASLARLERAMSEASRAPGPETLPGHGSLEPAILLLAPGTRLKRPDSVKLLRLDFDFAEAVAAADRGERPAQPPAFETCVAVARSHYRVQLHTLDAAQFAWLEALGRTGADPWATAAHVGDTLGEAAENLGATLLTWIPLALQAGLIVPAEDRHN